MITFGMLRWGWMFSYGDSNELDLSKAQLTQIVGANGHGKSSIALVLEELLYNKNSKGIKKSDILNRNAASRRYWASLEFTKDSDEYTLDMSRGSTQSVVLTKNSKDISQHTATQTYKLIEDILGWDHKTFSQIVYLSSPSSLEFLTATDSTRKKFLIELFNLGHYLDYNATFKAAMQQVELEAAAVSSKVTVYQAILDKAAGTQLTYQDVNQVPEYPQHLEEEKAAKASILANLAEHNRRIAQNLKYKELRDNLAVAPISAKPQADLVGLTKSSTELNKTAEDADKFIKKMRALGSQCVTCLQEVDEANKSRIITHNLTEKTEALNLAAAVDLKIKQAKLELASWERQSEINRKYAEYNSLYDSSLGAELMDTSELTSDINKLTDNIRLVSKQITEVEKANAKILADNSKLDLLTEQSLEVSEGMALARTQQKAILEKAATLGVLVKTFSTSGLVAYKIECMIKDLEELTNKYLLELSDGRFQLNFKIVGSDKLNVVISDNGKDVDITALSGGERARVNTSALLGIRLLMQSISKSRINLLILDETVDALDVEGKERLVEVLLAEPYLNTFLISHGFTHPLLEKLSVNKTNNISRIE